MTSQVLLVSGTSVQYPIPVACTGVFVYVPLVELYSTYYVAVCIVHIKRAEFVFFKSLQKRAEKELISFKNQFETTVVGRVQHMKGKQGETYRLLLDWQ